MLRAAQVVLAAQPIPGSQPRLPRADDQHIDLATQDMSLVRGHGRPSRSQRSRRGDRPCRTGSALRLLAGAAVAASAKRGRDAADDAAAGAGDCDCDCDCDGVGAGNGVGGSRSSRNRSRTSCVTKRTRVRKGAPHPGIPSSGPGPTPQDDPLHPRGDHDAPPRVRHGGGRLTA